MKLTKRSILLLLAIIVAGGIGLWGCQGAAQKPAPAAGQALPGTPATKTAPRVASYNIQVTLDPQTKMLNGHEVISYTNTTADPIPDLVFHLYLNAFKDENTIFMKESGQASRSYSWNPAHPGWIQASGLRVKGGPELALNLVEDGTLAHAMLPAPIQPGQTGVFELDFQALLPKVFARTGFAGAATGNDYFMVGQWFPKLGVWQPVGAGQQAGWNAYPFHANSEFYADFGSYQVEITLPEKYVTGGGGVLVSTQSRADGTKTVTYRSDQVIDFSWTASPHYKEAHRKVGNTDLVYLYLPEHAWSVSRELEAAGAALQYYSAWYGPYPYPRLTVVDVPDDGEGAGGMEYPTLVTAGTMSQLGVKGLEQVGLDRSMEITVIHEVGHQWFQSMVATNEAEEPWLDEGFTDYSTVRAVAADYGEYSSLLRGGSLKVSYLDLQRASYLEASNYPMGGKAWDYPNMISYASGVYSKPDLALSTLERILGEETMGKVMSTYFQRYQFAHPNTQDFREVAEQVSKQDLSWFFDGLVFGKGTLNYTIQALDDHMVTVSRSGELAIPTEVRVNFADGSQVVEGWDGKAAAQTFRYPDRAAITSATVDPQRKILMDTNWSDNGRSRRADLWSWGALVVRMFYNLENGLMNWGGL